jgi:hypothetical protein
MGIRVSPEPIREMPASALFTNPPVFPHNPRRGLVAALRDLTVRLLAWIWAVRPEVWWLLLFGCLLVAFGLVLLGQPTVGRGGR